MEKRNFTLQFSGLKGSVRQRFVFSNEGQCGVLVSRWEYWLHMGRVLATQGGVLASYRGVLVSRGSIGYTVLVLYREVLARDRGEYWLYRGSGRDGR